MLDPTSVSVIGIIGGALGFLIRSVFTAGQKESGITSTVDSHGKRLDDHGRRLGEHDARFSQLGQEFVPRPEVERAIGSIEKSQQRSEQLLLHLVTGRPVKPELSE